MTNLFLHLQKMASQYRPALLTIGWLSNFVMIRILVKRRSHNSIQHFIHILTWTREAVGPQEWLAFFLTKPQARQYVRDNNSYLLPTLFPGCGKWLRHQTVNCNTRGVKQWLVCGDSHEKWTGAPERIHYSKAHLFLMSNMCNEERRWDLALSWCLNTLSPGSRRKKLR